MAEPKGYSGKGARKMLGVVNNLRKERGESPIGVKGLDLDDDD